MSVSGEAKRRKHAGRITRLRLINLINKNVGEAVLIWRGHEGRAGWELGLELQGRTRDFWNIDF